MTATRQATQAEIQHHLGYYVRNGCKMRFRHFVREIRDRRALDGVRHVVYSKAVPFVKNDILCVKHAGQELRLTATATSKGDRVDIWDVRVFSEYLPPL